MGVCVPLRFNGTLYSDTFVSSSNNSDHDFNSDCQQAPDGSASGGGAATAFFNGLGLLIAMTFAALAIILIALVITKMRRRQSSDSTESIEMEMPTDPYLQAIMFPSEPRPEWHRHLRSMLHKAGQKIFRKQSEAHDTTIPEDLRYQLKQIYVY